MANTAEEAGSREHPFRDDLLAGRVAIVTGGGTGLGRAIAANGETVSIDGGTWLSEGYFPTSFPDCGER